MDFRIVGRQSGEQAEGRPVQLRPGAARPPARVKEIRVRPLSAESSKFPD
jgi:hypothetical protein